MGCLLSYPSLEILTRMFRRHQALHSAKSTINACQGCGKTFSRLDALNVSHTPLQPLLRWCAMLIPGCLTHVFHSGTVSSLVRFSASPADIDHASPSRSPFRRWFRMPTGIRIPQQCPGIPHRPRPEREQPRGKGRTLAHTDTFRYTNGRDQIDGWWRRLY
jgi:hypothetical protein